jgi:copper transport protein
VTRRVLLLAAIAVAACVLLPSTALAHAVLISSNPTAKAQLTASPAEVTMRFSESVNLLKPSDVSVVDSTGQEVDTGDGGLLPSDHRVVRIGLRPKLPDGTYTVRYLIVSADSHVIGGYFVFGVGSGALGPPFLGGGGERGPSETSAWAVSARFLELLGLGGLVGVLAFRWLVWLPAWRGLRARPTGATALLHWERDAFWTTFGVLAVGAMLAEGYLLVVKSASALSVSVGSVLRDPQLVSTVLGSTHFGSLVQWRSGLLFGLFLIGAWRFLVESSPKGEPTVERPSGRLLPAAIMLGLALSAIALISAQGHASQAPISGLQVADDLVHLASVSIWITGLGLTAVALLRLPVVGDGGAVLAASVLARFSRLALIAVTLAVATGVVRSFGELSDPSQLWDTSYGRSIIYKILLLVPVATLALRNRKVVTSLASVAVPNGPTLRMVRRTAALEMTVALAVVVVASILVAQVPGRV